MLLDVLLAIVIITGFINGFRRGLIYGTLLWFLDKMQIIPNEMREASQSFEYVVTFAPLVAEEFSKIIPWFQGMIESIERFLRERPGEVISKGIQV